MAEMDNVKKNSNILRKVVGSDSDIGVCGDYYFQAVGI